MIDFMSDTTLHVLENVCMKTEEHDVSRNCQRFLYSAAIELDVFLLIYLFNLRPRPIALQLFYAPYAVLLLANVISQAGLIVRSTRSRMLKSASSAGIPEVQ